MRTPATFPLRRVWRTPDAMMVAGAPVAPGEEAVGSHELHYVALRSERPEVAT